MNQETASVVIPPDASSPYCPNGRAFVSFGGWLQQVDLNWVSSPNGHASQRTLSSIMNFPVNFPTQTIPTGVCSGMACCATSTAPTYAVGGNDTSMVRTGPRSLLLLMAGNRRMTRFGTTPVCGGDAQSACSPQLANAVNFVIRSDDCGDTWTPTIAVDNGDGAGGPAPGASGLCGNLDFARVYVDPWKSSAGHNFIYIFGYTGPSCCGGVDRAVLYRSDDGGATFVKKATFPRSTGAMGLTSYPDGTTVVFGCSDDQMGSPPHKGPRVLWSYGNDDTNFDNPPSTPTGGGYFDGDILPACATTDYLGGVFHFGPDMSSMSRMLDGSNSDSYNYFRFAYQTTIDDRNGVAVGYGVVPRFGSGAAAHMVQTGTIATASAGSDILRASSHRSRSVRPQRAEYVASFLGRDRRQSEPQRPLLGGDGLLQLHPAPILQPEWRQQQPVDTPRGCVDRRVRPRQLLLRQFAVDGVHERTQLLRGLDAIARELPAAAERLRPLQHGASHGADLLGR